MHEVTVAWVNSVRIWSMIRTYVHWLSWLVIVPVTLSARSHVRSVCLSAWLSVHWTGHLNRSFVVRWTDLSAC